MGTPTGKHLKTYAVTLTCILGVAIMYRYELYPTRSVSTLTEWELLGTSRPLPPTNHSFAFKLDTELRDVIVFIHIQKTGGKTFDAHLRDDLIGTRPCSCEYVRKLERPGKTMPYCKCVNSKNQTWLLSRSTRSWLCGVHPDWTNLHHKHCAENAFDQMDNQARPRRLHYITILKDPVERYISEHRHITSSGGRYVTGYWDNAKYHCKYWKLGLKRCFDDTLVTDLPLDKFIKCKDNPGNNRLTRMLADMRDVGCREDDDGLTDTEREAKMLDSAKRNVENLSFFGFVEEQYLSKLLFEATFDVRFRDNFVQESRNGSRYVVTPLQRTQIRENVKLDIQLYEFARHLFYKRLAEFGIDRTSPTRRPNTPSHPNEVS